jgi:23S rRNA (guanine745-N1)-methyltransferase
LERLPGWEDLALDASRPALRRAARAHGRVGAIGCDTWSPLPVRGGTAELALDVFAPRNAGEVSRVLVPGGAFVVATPTPLHLEPLVSELGLIGVHKDKQRRLADTLFPFFASEGGRDV